MTPPARTARSLAIAAVFLSMASASAASPESAAASAAAWLGSAQNPDGSWGGAVEIQPLVTSEAVLALRAQGRRGAAYLRGITWLENHAMTSVDAQARRIVALRAHGDDVTRDVDALTASFSIEGFQNAGGFLASGWGLAGPYGPSALDTGLTLLAFAELGVPSPAPPDVVDAAVFLFVTQVEGADLGWQAAIGTDNPQGDPITTAVVLRSLAALRSAVSGLQSTGDDAASFLQSAVDASSTSLQRAHAALALLRWTPGTAAADAWLAALETSQAPDGSWGGDPYTTAVALRAFAAKLGTDDPILQQNVFIPDLGLRAAINLALGKARVDAITRGEMQSLTDLDARRSGIEDLTGIEEATGLETIDLVGNDIDDYSPLDTLPSLTDALLALPCDPSGDEIVDTADALLALRALQLGTPLDAADLQALDIAPPSAPDGALTAGDAIVLLRAAAGESMPACGS